MIINQHLSAEAQRALEEFSTEFDAAFVGVEPESQWGVRYGNANTNRFQKTWTIPVSAAGFRRVSGDGVFRTLAHRAVSLVPELFEDGVEEEKRVIESPEFFGWNQQPANIAVEARRQPNKLVAEMLEANQNLDFYADRKQRLASTIPLFSDSHPVNVFDTSYGTFDNTGTDFSGTFNATLLREVQNYFRTLLQPNGEKFRLSAKKVLVPSERYQEIWEFLRTNLMLSPALVGGANTQESADNLYRGEVELVHCSELTDPNNIYFLDSDVSAPKPWVVSTGGAPEMIVYDESSDYYKSTGRIAFKVKIEGGAAGCLPHSILRVSLDS